MDFETLGDAILSDFSDDNELYIKVNGKEDLKRTGNFDLEKAKAFLSTVYERSNISLYDHLADVLKKILRSRISDAVERFEEISVQVKQARLANESDLTHVAEIGEELKNFLKEKQTLYKFISPSTDITQTIRADSDDDSEEEESDASEDAESKESIIDQAQPQLDEVLPDIHYIFNRFNQGGIGLSAQEVFELNIALKDLATTLMLRKIRFWGKVFGLKNSYYVAEAPYQDNIEQENFGWKNAEDYNDEDKDEENTEEVDEKEESDEEEEDKDKENTEQEEEAKLPPTPEPQRKEKKRIPPESNGSGVNEYMYFVCTKIGQPWRVLPFMKPLHIVEARYLKRFFTGDLESQIRGCVPFPGTEAHYLRAQIGRITASTYIAPKDYYTVTETGNETDNGEEEQKKDDSINLNKEYVPRTAKHVFSEGLKAWVHYKRAILDQGRCTAMKLKKVSEEEEEEEDDDDDDEEEEEETDKTEDMDEEKEEPEVLEAILETEVPVLRSVSEDKALFRLQPWSVNLSSKLVSEAAVVIMTSNLWPGSYTFYDGKTFDHVYIGWGYKDSAFNYAPPIRAAWQREYPVGDDILEHEDKEIFADESKDGDVENGNEANNENEENVER